MKENDDKIWDQELKHYFESAADSVKLDKDAEERILAGAHRQIQERKKNMGIIKKKKAVIIAAAAAVAMLGTITAVGAGTIEGLFTSVNTQNVDYSSEEEIKGAKSVLGAVPKAPDEFSNGLKLEAGYLRPVNGMDASGTVVGSYPSLFVSYGMEISLFIEKIPDSMKQDAKKQRLALTDAREREFAATIPSRKIHPANPSLQKTNQMLLLFRQSRILQMSLKSQKSLVIFAKGILLPPAESMKQKHFAPMIRPKENVRQLV